MQCLLSDMIHNNVLFTCGFHTVQLHDVISEDLTHTIIHSCMHGYLLLLADSIVQPFPSAQSAPVVITITTITPTVVVPLPVPSAAMSLYYPLPFSPS